MNTTKPTISVILCAYTEERWDDLVAAVASVQQQSLPAHEIILVIDHNPSLFERARLHLHGIAVIANGEARGLSGARNSGMAVASGDVFAFLDEDAVATPHWLERLHAEYDSPHVLGVGGAIIPRWPERRPAWFPQEFDWVVGCTYRGMPRRAAVVRNLIGCNMSFRRELFEQIGGFRNGIGRIGTIPLGCEETEFCIRARQRWPEGRFLYQPQARVHHRVKAERTTWRYFRERCYAEGLSKALVTRFVGENDGLSSERTYTLYTLPRAVLRGIGDTLFGDDTSGLARSLAVVVGLLITTLGYLRGTLEQARAEPVKNRQSSQSQGTSNRMAHHAKSLVP